MVGAVSPEASLAELKAKDAELTEKLRSVGISLLKHQERLNNAEMRLIAIEDKIYDQVVRWNIERPKSQQLSPREITNRVKNNVKATEGFEKIYDEIADLKEKVSELSTLDKINNKIADRVDNMTIIETTQLKHLNPR